MFCLASLLVRGEKGADTDIPAALDLFAQRSG